MNRLSLPEEEKLVGAACVLSAGLKLSINLSGLRGYQYYSGVMFASYVDKLPQSIFC